MLNVAGCPDHHQHLIYLTWLQTTTQTQVEPRDMAMITSVHALSNKEAQLTAQRKLNQNRKWRLSPVREMPTSTNHSEGEESP